MIRPSVLILLALILHLGASIDECDDDSIGKTLQDPEDCHGYYLCHSGHKLQQYCAPGMKYEENIGSCVVGKCPPCNCDDVPSTTPTESTTTTESSSTCESSSTSDSPSTSSASESTESSTDSSPTESSTDSSSTEPSTDSSTLKPTTTQQPTESSTESTADSSGSDSTSTSDDSSSTQSTVSSTDSPSTTTPADSSSQSPTPSNPHPPVSCENIQDGSFFSDPVHCRDYYVCRNGEPVLLHCQKGQWFDDVHFVCNFPYLVNCPANID